MIETFDLGLQILKFKKVGKQLSIFGKKTH